MLVTINLGLRNGGGIGDVLEPVKIRDDQFLFRFIFDIFFFFIVIIIIMNIIFGIIIDTFADLRGEKAGTIFFLKKKIDN